MPSPIPAKYEVKGLWALCWRMLLLGPFVAIFGSLFLIAVLAAYLLPLYALVEVIGGNYLESIVIIALWILWLRFGKPFRKISFEGLDYGSL
jgi:hypothetical protein